MTRTRKPALVLALVAALTALGACGGGPDATPSQPPATSTAPSTAPSTPSPSSSASSNPPGAVPYVALGDSYTSAPGLPPTADTGCGRSASNYPHLIAADDAAVQLDDVSCSGADSSDVLSQQVAALSDTTALVTVGIGGNDQGLFITLLGGCTQLAAPDPTGDPCTRVGRAPATAALKVIATNLGQVLDTIHDRAPNAEVLVVGYPRLLPASGSCRDRTPIATGDYAFVTSVNRRLTETLRRAAAQHDDGYVDVFGPSRGHDICSADPWVNGATTAPDGVIPYHPLAAEQRAVASLVERQATALR